MFLHLSEVLVFAHPVVEKEPWVHFELFLRLLVFLVLISFLASLASSATSASVTYFIFYLVFFSLLWQRVSPVPALLRRLWTYVYQVSASRSWF